MADHMAVQVTMYLTEGDSWHHRSLHLEILKYLREENVAGAAVFQFGHSSIWPGDTLGVSAGAANNLGFSWGGAIPPQKRGKKDEVFAAPVSIEVQHS